jgi:membrane fusion protein (multidrug efflux system)
MKSKIGVAILLVLLVVGALAGVKVLQIGQLMAAGKSFTQPPESISSAEVRQEDWQSAFTAIGSVTAMQGVTIAPELAGTITEIAFEPGAVVNKGDLLVRLDTSAEVAQLRALEAQVELARLNLERERTLRSQDLISQSELDGAEATLKQNQASADAIKASIDKKTIRAPFSGRLGIRLANLGQFLDVGKPIVSLQSLSPIYADFSLPQQDLAQLKTGLKVRLTIDAFPDKAFEGSLTAINPDLDATTRSVGLQATFENTDQLLRPGMFARVEVLLPEQKSVLVIPITSILSAPYGDSVYVIEPAPAKDGAPPGLTVRQQFVKVGRARGDFIAVESGLKVGDRVVSSGVFKLRNGMPVVENNKITPKSSDVPHPADS